MPVTLFIKLTRSRVSENKKTKRPLPERPARSERLFSKPLAGCGIFYFHLPCCALIFLHLPCCAYPAVLLFFCALTLLCPPAFRLPPNSYCCALNPWLQKSECTPSSGLTKRRKQGSENR